MGRQKDKTRAEQEKKIPVQFTEIPLTRSANRPLLKDSAAPKAQTIANCLGLGAEVFLSGRCGVSRGTTPQRLYLKGLAADRGNPEGAFDLQSME
jgi:hypothetical protein